MKAIQLYQGFDDLQRVAAALFESKYFSDTSSKAQAIAKVVAGAEIGLPPFASMTGIHIIKGKPTLGSNLIATLVENDPRYEYFVVESTDTECVIDWFRGDQPVGQSSFNMDDAKRAGLLGKSVWSKYPSDLLFARAITQGARRYAAGIFGGSPVYTAEEMGEDIIEGEFETKSPQDADKRLEEIVKKEFEKPEPPPDDDELEEIVRPYSAKTLKQKFAQAMSEYKGKAPSYQVVAAQLGELLPDDTDRKAATRWLTGNESGSTKKLSNPQRFAFSIMLTGLPQMGFDDTVKPECVQELQAALTAAKKAEGQEELL